MSYDNWPCEREQKIRDLENGGWERQEAENMVDWEDERSDNYQPDNPHHTCFYDD